MEQYRLLPIGLCLLQTGRLRKCHWRVQQNCGRKERRCPKRLLPFGGKLSETRQKTGSAERF